MKKLLLSLCVMLMIMASAQDSITRSQIEVTEKMFGLSFNDSKRDSMIGYLTGRLKTYSYLRSKNLNNGMPASISFIGKHFGEADLLAFAKAYQLQTGFHLKHPPGYLL